MKTVCLVGDSNFRLIMPKLQSQLSSAASTTGDDAPTVVLRETFMHDVCSDRYVPSPEGDAGFLDHVRHCMEVADHVIISLGSHAPGMSAAEMGEAAANLTKLVAAHHSIQIARGNQRRKCVLVTATTDAAYESVPLKFDQNQRYYRSSARVLRKNNVLRHTLAAGGASCVPSAAERPLSAPVPFSRCPRSFGMQLCFGGEVGAALGGQAFGWICFSFLRLVGKAIAA
jgi:hypothetical protein